MADNMIEITIDDRAVRAALDRLQRRLSDLSPVMRAIATELEARVEARFETATDPAGRPWAPLKPSTLAAYLARGKGNRRKDGSLTKKGAARLASRKPLYDTGDLLEAINSDAGLDYALIGVNGSVEYATTHQFGAKKGQFGKTRRGAPIPWGDIPARPFMPITPDRRLYDEEKRAIIDTLAEFLSGSRMK